MDKTEKENFFFNLGLVNCAEKNAPISNETKPVKFNNMSVVHRNTESVYKDNTGDIETNYSSTFNENRYSNVRQTQQANCFIKEMKEEYLEKSKKYLTMHPKEIDLQKYFRQVLKTESKIRKFQCALCDKCFKFKHHLKEHNILHSGEKPHKCEVCQVGFAHSGSLSKHIRSNRHLKKMLSNSQSCQLNTNSK